MLPDIAKKALFHRSRRYHRSRTAGLNLFSDITPPYAACGRAVCNDATTVLSPDRPLRLRTMGSRHGRPDRGFGTAAQSLARPGARRAAPACSSTATTPSGSAICGARARSPTRSSSECPDASVVIISGSPVIGNFEFGSGVDYVRIPGVTKLPDGDYRSLNLNRGARRGRRRCARPSSCRPPRRSGPTSSSSTRSRPAFAARSCRRSRTPEGARLPARARHPRRHGRAGAAGARMGAQGRRSRRSMRYYDEIWVYGLKEIYEPLVALDLPRRGRARASPIRAICAARCRTSRTLARYPKLTQAALRAGHDRRRRRRRRPDRLGDLRL